MNRVAGIVCVVLIISCLAACGGCGAKNQSSSRPQDLILGKWTRTTTFGNGQTTTSSCEFTKDGVIRELSGGTVQDAKYRFIDDNHIQFSNSAGVPSKTITIVDTAKDKIATIDEHGVRTELTRFENGGHTATNLPSSKPQDLILGKWTWTGTINGQKTTVSNEFIRDGVVKVVQGGIPLEVKYRFIDDNHIQYDDLAGAPLQTSTIADISKDRLIVVDEQGVKREWTRP